MNKRIQYVDFSKDAEKLNLPTLTEYNHYQMKLNPKDSIEVADMNALINETGMQWDKHMGVTCSNRDAHGIILDAEEGPVLKFQKEDIPIINKYFFEDLA